MEVRVLGELEVVGPGGVAIDVAGSRLRRLVTRLAVDAGHVVPSAELVDAVWGDDPPADPVGALQTLVSRLRRALGNPAVVQQSHQGYRLTVASDAVDAQRFRRLARQGRDQLAAGDAATARTTLADALECGAGPPSPTPRTASTPSPSPLASTRSAWTPSPPGSTPTWPWAARPTSSPSSRT